VCKIKASKYTVNVCWLLILISLLVVWILQCEIDIYIQTKITQSIWTYDYSVRDFYSGFWGNVLTGAIVSLITSYVLYGRAKHQNEFILLMNEQSMCMEFNSILCGLYTVDKINVHNNVCRFKYNYSKLDDYYASMIAASNDYSPFVRTKKAKTLISGKHSLQSIWLDIACYKDDFIILSGEAEIQKAICSLQSELLSSKEIIDILYKKLMDLSK